MEVFDYEDIQLIPNKCIIKSRSDADTSIKFGPKTFKIPVGWNRKGLNSATYND